MSREADIWNCIKNSIGDDYKEAELFLNILEAIDTDIYDYDDYKMLLGYTNITIEQYYTYQKSLSVTERNDHFIHYFEKEEDSDWGDVLLKSSKKDYIH